MRLSYVIALVAWLLAVSAGFYGLGKGAERLSNLNLELDKAIAVLR